MKPQIQDSKQVSADEAITRLTAMGEIKVWSLLATIFGGFASNDGDQISGTHLTKIMTRIGVKPEAMRVAIHRLKKDGWITVEKSGRINRYGLSDVARAETHSVSAQIFASKIDERSDWGICLGKPAAAVQIPMNALPIGSFGFIAPLDARGDHDCLFGKLDQRNLPHWLEAELLPKHHRTNLNELYAVMAALQIDDDINTLEFITLNVLVLHNWRRLALRQAPLIEALMGPEWIGAKCRKLAIKTLNQLQCALADLDKV